MGSYPSVKITLLGPQNAGKSTFINSQHVGKTLQTDKKEKGAYIKNKWHNFEFVDTTGFSNEAGLGWSRINKFKGDYNIILIADIKDSWSWNYSQKIFQKLKQSSIKKPLFILGNQKNDPSLISNQPIQPVRFVEFCFKNCVYGQICDLKDKKKVQRIYSVIGQLTYLKQNKQSISFSISLIGQKNSGKTSIRKMIFNSNYNTENLITDQKATINVNARSIQIEISDGPGFDFQNGQLLWSSMEFLAKKDILVIVMDLSSAKATKYLTEILQILYRDYKGNNKQLNFQNIVIVGNKKEYSVVGFEEIKIIPQKKYNPLAIHYIQFKCNEPSNKQPLLHYLSHRYLLSR